VKRRWIYFRIEANITGSSERGDVKNSSGFVVLLLEGFAQPCGKWHNGLSELRTPAMTESTENLVLESLRQMRNDMSDLRNELREGFNRVEVRLGLVEQGLAGMLSVSASDREEIRALKHRVERIERRLELQE
jgi:hypothetical protein